MGTNNRYKQMRLLRHNHRFFRRLRTQDKAKIELSLVAMQIRLPIVVSEQ